MNQQPATDVDSLEPTPSSRPSSLARLWLLYSLAVLAIGLISWWMMQQSHAQQVQPPNLGAPNLEAPNQESQSVMLQSADSLADQQRSGSDTLIEPAGSVYAPYTPRLEPLVRSPDTSTNEPVDNPALVRTSQQLHHADATLAEDTTTDLAQAGQLAMEVDVLVYGSEPEAISAAVSAAEEGARVVLVTPDPKLGGLFVMGQMNSLDLRSEPVLLQRGVFERWWELVGRGSAFDVAEAEAAFERLLAEAGVQVLRDIEPVEVMTNQGQIVGIRNPQQHIRARHIIDGSADGTLAAQVGVPYSMGFRSMGIDARMVDTLVFRIDGVDWQTLRREITRRGKEYAEVNDEVAWGFFGRNWIAEYEAQEEGIRLRGLNLGRQKDGSILVNALLIHGIDPFDPASRAEGRARATREAGRILDILKKELPAFENARFGGVAPSLYIRETQHIMAHCNLTVDDVMNNLVTEHDVAAGGYPLDVQVLTPNDSGFVYGVPEVYGVQLCVTVPLGIEGLWVVGKTAGYDPLAASSARVVPFGMALAEAVGVAAAMAEERLPSAFIQDDAAIAELREVLQRRGAYLAEVRPRNPSGPYTHPYYDAFVTLRRKALALGGYDNDPKLDATMPALGYLYLLANVGERFYDSQGLAQQLIDVVGLPEGALTPALALQLSHTAACQLAIDSACERTSWQALQDDGLAPQRFAPAQVSTASSQALTRGEAYALAAAIAQRAP